MAAAQLSATDASFSPSFLARVAAAVLEGRAAEGVLDLSDTAVIFPNRRAGLFFQQELARAAGRPLWAPAVWTMGDLVRQVAPGLTLADPVALVVLLHGLWVELGSAEPLDSFYAFGQRLADDLDEIDRHLADPDQVLQNLNELKALEAWAGLPDDELEALRRFWATLSSEPLRPHQASFVEQFARLRPLYHRYTAALAARGWTTEGRLARALVERLKAGDAIALPERLFFCGLGALPEADRQIIARLARRGQARVLPDLDAYYLSTLPHHEARAAVEPQLAFVQQSDIPARIGQQPVHLELVGAAQGSGVARAAGQVLARWQAEGSLVPERTAVLLADEGLLFAVLQQLPAGLGAVNVTMGYPLMQTATARLLRASVELQLRAWRDAQGAVSGYPLRPLRELLQHPYAQLADAQAGGEVAEWLRRALDQGWTFATLAELPPRRGELLERLLSPLAPEADLVAHLRATALALHGSIAEQAGATPVVDLEAAVALHAQLQRLGDVLTETTVSRLPLEAQWRLVRQVLLSARLPFSGEPLEGLQVMGLLESRTLEFDSLIVCSANEGTLPRPTNLSQSLIPYTLRQAFGLPTPELTDAVASYNFWRLLHGARRVALIYDSVGREGGSEPSRYLDQIRYELAPGRPAVTLVTRAAAAEAQLAPPPELTVTKTPDILARLAELVARQLSPTPLLSYVACPMQFYYRYVPQIAEPDASSDTLDGRQFGNVLHDTLEALYKPLIDQSCGPAELEARQRAVSAALTQAAEAEPALRHHRLGKNLLLLRVIEALASQVLRIDAELAAQRPLTPLQLEHELTRTLTLPSGRTLTLKGRLDRIDRHGPTRRIIDYKTGHVAELPKSLAVEQVIERLFTGDEHPEVLQGLLYAWLMNDDLAMAEGQLEVLIYPMRRLQQGPMPITRQSNVAEAWPLFEPRLVALLSELLDPAVPFVQKKDEQRCDYCPYYRLCYGL
ncbi:MAG: PD-(D/E)XK nuclease family protein [Microscillaceae bacterium]|nr:PD-(D/E)XK nuclease family protein [Microscillaceae bacterium]